MSLTQLTANLSNHQAMPDEPNSNNGYTPEVIKETFDKAPNDIKNYINSTLIPEIMAQFTEKAGDHPGTWQGLDPVQTDVGMAAIVELHTEQINNASVGTVSENDIVVQNNKKYTNDKTAIINTNKVTLGENSELEDLTVNTSSAEGISFLPNTNNHELENVSLSGADIGFNLNVSNVKRTKVKGSKLKATGAYPVLVNQNSKGGSNLSIIDNTIETPNGDGIEINTPNDGTDTFRGIRVIGNHIECGTEGTTPNAGFAIGIAQGQDVVVMGNVVEGSRQEQLHIEDCSENVSVIGNVFNNCNADGCKVLNRYRLPGVYTKVPIISGNHFKALTNKKTHKGLYRVYDANLIVDGMNFTNNRLEGFDTALHFEGGGVVDVNGCVIENCNKAIAVSGKVKGSVITSNTPTLLSFNGNGSVEDITSLTPITLNGLFAHTLDTNSLGQINKFKFPLANYTSVENTTNNIGLFKTPKYLKGTIQAKTVLYGGSTFIQGLGEIEVIDGVLTYTSKLTKSYGAYSSASFALSSGYVCFQYYNATVSQIMYTTVEFDGTLIIDSTT